MTACAFVNAGQFAECVNCGDRIPLAVLPESLVLSEINSTCACPRGRCEYLGEQTGQILGKESGACRKCGGMREFFCDNPARRRVSRTGKLMPGRCTTATKSEMYPAVESCAFCELFRKSG